MEEERVRILGMVKEGKITPEEGIKLLEALETSTEDQADLAPSGKAKWFRVRVTDVKTNKPKVTVNLPIGLVDWALRTGSRVAAFGGADLNGMGINLEELRAAINFGVRGKIIDVTDEDGGEHVEIIVE
jgi:hypothetical protein